MKFVNCWSGLFEVFHRIFSKKIEKESFNRMLNIEACNIL
jgi:hypothetical protein